MAQSLSVRCCIGKANLLYILKYEVIAFVKNLLYSKSGRYNVRNVRKCDNDRRISVSSLNLLEA